MGQWGKPFIYEEMLFTPHVHTGDNAFDQIDSKGTINDFLLTDDGGHPEKAEIVLGRLKAEWLGKPYYSLWPALQKSFREMPDHIKSTNGVRVTEKPLTDLERAKAITASRAKLVEAEEAHKAVIKETYPLGSYVRWRERPYIKAGIVRGYSLSGDSLRVDETNSRNNRTVPMRAVLMAAFEDDK